MGGRTSTGGLGVDAPQPSQVQNNLRVLHESIIEVEEQLKILGSRLIPVLRDDDSDKTTSAEPSGLVPLADSIRGATRNVEGLVRHVHSLIDRLEL